MTTAADDVNRTIGRRVRTGLCAAFALPLVLFFLTMSDSVAVESLRRLMTDPLLDPHLRLFWITNAPLYRDDLGAVVPDALAELQRIIDASPPGSLLAQMAAERQAFMLRYYVKEGIHFAER